MRKGNLTEVVAKLEESKSERITLLMLGEFGFPAVSNTTVHEVKIGSYAQYDEAIFLIHRPARKRKYFRKVILPYQSFVIWEGWEKVDTDMYKPGVVRNGMVMQESKYSSFDKRYLLDSLNSVKKAPLVKWNIEEEVLSNEGN